MVSTWLAALRELTLTGRSPKASFRTGGPSPSLSADPAFFHQHQQAHAFDLAPLKGALPFAPPVGPQGPHLHADLDGAWAQQPRTEHFEASFRPGPSTGAHARPPVPAQNGWARDFHTRESSPSTMSASPSHASSFQQHSQQSQHIGYQQPMMGTGMGRLNMMGMGVQGGFHPASMQPMYGQQHQDRQQPQEVQGSSVQRADDSVWDTAFTAYDSQRPASPPQSMAHQTEQKAQQQRPITDPHEADELARTAGKLVSTVEHDTSDKFKKSNFLNLMRKIRDKQAGIQGTDIVEGESFGGASADSAPVPSVDKGKAREMSSSQSDEMITNGQLPPSLQRRLASQTPSDMGLLGQTALEHELKGRQELNEMWAEEDARSEAIERQAMQRSFAGDGGNVLERRQEDDELFAKYMGLNNRAYGTTAPNAAAGQEEEFVDRLSSEDFVGRRWEGTKGKGVGGAQSAEWDKLQSDWDAWEADSAGFKPSLQPPRSADQAPAYRFHQTNPYINGHAAAGVPADMASVLEKEAAVQMDPNNATAWLDLGVKQQENERESLAIAALHRAIQLDPTLKDAWLALAVSYTNENDRMAAFEATERWIGACPEYNDVVKQFQGERGDVTSATLPTHAQRHERLTNLLMALARHGSMQNRIDADVQVALGVLFNASEDYDKAVDCFSAALEVRPDDWLLYNRLGATLSNSGRSDVALGYYHQALDLRPGFVRCHFNLSISCLNLKVSLLNLYFS